MREATLSVGFLLLAASLWAGPKPGQYAVTMSSTVEGMPLKPQSTSLCHTQADADHPDVELPKKMSGACTIAKVKLAKDVLTWSATCPPNKDGKLSATYSFTFGADGYQGHETVRSGEKTIEVEVKASLTSPK